MKISRSRIYKILNTHNQSMKKQGKARKQKRRIKRSRKVKNHPRNLRYRTLKKKGGARIKLDSNTETAKKLIIGYQSALSSYIDALNIDNKGTQIILSGAENPSQIDYFARLLKTTLAKGISEEIKNAQSADKSVLEKLTDGIFSIFSREDSSAKESFSTQLNNIVEREKLVEVVQNDLKYDTLSNNKKAQIIIKAINDVLVADNRVPNMSEMIKRFGFGVGIDSYFDLEISKQEMVVDSAINKANEKIDELRLRLDTVTSEQKTQLKSILDELVVEINTLLAMFGIFSAAGGGSISILDYQNEKLSGFTDNPAGAGAMAFSMNQKAIHEEVIETLTRKIDQTITFYPKQEIGPLIDTKSSSKNIGLITLSQMSVYPITSNPWKTGETPNAYANSIPAPIVKETPDSSDIENPDAKESAMNRLNSLEKQKGIAPSVGVGPQEMDDNWDDGGRDQPTTTPQSGIEMADMSNDDSEKSLENVQPKPTTTPPVEIEMTDMSKDDSETSPFQTSPILPTADATSQVTQSSTVQPSGVTVPSNDVGNNVSSELTQPIVPSLVQPSGVTVPSNDVGNNVSSELTQPIVPSLVQPSGVTAPSTDAEDNVSSAVVGDTNDSVEGNILEKCDRPEEWNTIVSQKADGMTIYLCPAFTNNVFNAEYYKSINNISGSDSFCGFIAIMVYLVEVSKMKPYWDGVTGGDPNYWLNELVEKAKIPGIKVVADGVTSYPSDLMNDFMVKLRTLSNDPNRDRFMHDSDMDALSKITNTTFCVWERTNAIGAGWTYVSSDNSVPGISFPPIENPPPPCLLVHDASINATSPTGHYDFIDNLSGGMKTYLSMPNKMFETAYAISDPRRPTNAAQQQSDDGAKRKDQTKTDTKTDTIDPNMPFPDSVKNNNVCEAAIADNNENEKNLFEGSCAKVDVFINYFKVLEIEQPSAWNETFKKDVNRIYKKMSLKYHPDKAKGDASTIEGLSARFKCISEAREVLTVPDLYNRYIALMPLCTGDAELPTGQQPDPTTGQQSDPTTGQQPDPTTGQQPDPTTGQQPDPSQNNSNDQGTPSQTNIPDSQSQTTPLQTEDGGVTGVSTKSTTTQMPNGDVEVNIRVKIPKDAQFSINGNAGSPTETVIRGLVDNINSKNGGTKKKRSRKRKQTRRKKN